MTPQTKALLLNFFSFAIIYLLLYAGIKLFLNNITGFWIPLSSAILASFLAPKFQALKTKEGDKLFMKSIFFRDVKKL